MRKILGGLAAVTLGLLAVVGLGIAPASAHTPASSIDCAAAHVSLVSYDQGATAEITVDGVSVHTGTFGGHLVADYPVTGNAEHELVVVVDSHDGDQYDYSADKTTTGCYVPPAPVIEQHDESGCVGTTQYRTHTWTTTDGVVSDEVDTTATLSRQEAIDLGCYVPPVVECDDSHAPGILNEYGDPTSCVSNEPCPDADSCPTVPPTPPVTPPHAPELAMTGTDPAPYLAVAWALILAGLLGKGVQIARRR